MSNFGSASFVGNGLDPISLNFLSYNKEAPLLNMLSCKTWIKIFLQKKLKIHIYRERNRRKERERERESGIQRERDW